MRRKEPIEAKASEVRGYVLAVPDRLGQSGIFYWMPEVTEDERMEKWKALVKERVEKGKDRGVRLFKATLEEVEEM